jgi:biopolymer transport protein ExbD
MKVRRKHTPLSDAEVNLTPLIDVCFVVLIMFIVVAPILEMERVELASGPPLDQKSVLAVQEQSPLTLHVDSNDVISLNHQRISLAQLKGALLAAKAKNPKGRPQLFHDKNAKFGTYQAVKNALEAAGFTEMDLILKPQ